MDQNDQGEEAPLKHPKPQESLPRVNIQLSNCKIFLFNEAIVSVIVSI